MICTDDDGVADEDVICADDCPLDTPWSHCPRCGAPVTWDNDPGCDECGLILDDSE